MELEHIVVVFESPDGRNLWKPVEREQIPDWLRDQDIFDRLLQGEIVRNTAEKEVRFFKVIEVERPRPAGYRDAKKREEAFARAMSPGGIQLLH